MQSRSSSSSFQGQRNQAFTLIEILVVIGIIALLSAVLFSAFNGVRGRAQRATCTSNLQQIGKALELYAQDYRGFYPLPTVYPAANQGYCFWGDRIFPYVRSTAIFECPSHRRGGYRTGCPAKEEVSDGLLYYHGSYAMNIMGNKTANDQINPLHQARIRNPSGAVLVTGNGEGGSSVHVNPGEFPVKTPEELEGKGVTRRHGKGDNLLFADGHVKWMSLETMVQKGRDLWLPAGAN